MNRRRIRFEVAFGQQATAVLGQVIENSAIAAWTFAEQIEEPPKTEPPTP